MTGFVLSPSTPFLYTPPPTQQILIAIARGSSFATRGDLAGSAYFMPSELELAVILTTYERPAHLERSLRSLNLQRNMAGKFEVIVADDGSQDETHAIVRSFARTADFPVKWVTHPHRGFRAALSRNDGVRATTVPYLVFVDGDCLLPEDHLRNHLLARRPGVVRAGDCLRLDKTATERIDSAAIDSGAYRNWISGEERQRLFQKKLKDRYYQWIRHTAKPKLISCDIGIWRDDFEAVNGFDEQFVGWGCEDDDLGIRLRLAGRRVLSTLGYTHGYHMWHPTEPSRPEKWNDGANVRRLQIDRPIQCVHGLISTSEETDSFPRVAAEISADRSTAKVQDAA